MVLIDANILIAVASERDDLHESALDLMAALPVGQRVLSTVLIEACFLINQRNGVDAEVALLRSFEEGTFRFTELIPADLTRIADLVERYSDMNLGTADASLIAVAERLGIDTIATFNRRDFAVVRPAHIEAFTLLP